MSKRDNTADGQKLDLDQSNASRWKRTLKELATNFPPDEELRKLVRLINDDHSDHNLDAIKRDPNFITLWNMVYPLVALNLRRALLGLVGRVLAVDEVTVDIAIEAILRAVLDFDPAKATGPCAFVSYCVTRGRFIAKERIPDAVPVSFGDLRYEYTLRRTIDRFRTRHFQQHGEYPARELVASELDISPRHVDRLLSLGWDSSFDSDSPPDVSAPANAGGSASDAPPNSTTILQSLDKPSKDVVAVAGMLHIFDGRKKTLSPDDHAVIKASLDLLSWTAADKAALKDLLQQTISPAEAGRQIMLCLGRKPSAGAIRQYKLHLRTQLSQMPQFLNKYAKKGTA